MAKIIHIADTHLGYRQYNSEVRKDDFFLAFEKVVDDAIEHNVDAIVHAGDLFDMRNPPLTDILRTMHILSKLSDHDIPFLGIVGNHESKQDYQWLDLYEQIGIAKRLSIKPYYLDDIAIYGIDYVPKTKVEEQSLNIEEPVQGTKYTFLTMHQLAAHVPQGTFNCDLMLKEFPFNIDLFLLGDYHKYTSTRIGDTIVTYSGSTERHSSVEHEERTYNFIDTDNGMIDITRIRIPTRNFVYIPITLNDHIERPNQYIFDKVRERINEIEGSVVILSIDGNSSSTLSHSEIDEFLLSKGAVVSRVNDKRVMNEYMEQDINQTLVFLEPDEAVQQKLNKLHLTEGGQKVDYIVRNLEIPKSKVDDEVSTRIAEQLEKIGTKPKKKPRVSSQTLNSFL